MGTRSFDQSAKETYRQTVNVPGVAGNYGEFITFGDTTPGGGPQYFREITALVETLVAGAVVELWLPQVPDGSVAASDMSSGNYYNSGMTPLSAQGAVRWQLSAWPGAQLRVKSGGTPGAMVISAAGF